MEASGESFIGEILKAAQNPKMISFAGGLPALELFPDQVLQRCFQRVFEEQGKLALQYAQTSGYPPLRQWLAQQHTRKGRQVAIEEIVVTTGSQQGLSLLAQTFLDPGDIVLVETPTYLGAIQAFQSFRARMMMVPCDAQGIIPEELEKILRQVTPKFLYLIPNYQNPSGKIMGLERRRELLRVAQAYDLLVIEDNPYGNLRFEGEAIPDLIELGDNVIYLGTFSKILAPGLRVGYVVANPDILNHLCKTKEGVDLHSNSLTQRAVLEFLKEELLPEHILKLCTLYRERRNAMVRAIDKYLGDEVEMIVPSGGLFLWARFKKITNSFELLQKTIHQNVLFVPGSVFYPDGRLTAEARLNYSCSTPEVIEEGIQRLARAIRE
jgi:2-aminoadipate transaminase